MRNYKKWRRQQMTIYGAEKVLEREEAKRNVKTKFASAGAKYVPSSLNEIQLGTTLDIAKNSRVSFDPDNTLGEEATIEDDFNVHDSDEKMNVTMMTMMITKKVLFT